MGKPRQPIEHGTYAGYLGHARRSEQPCERCSAARREYGREYDSRPGVAAQVASRARARSRALSRLAAEYPERYRELLSEERSRSALGDGAHD